MAKRELLTTDLRRIKWRSIGPGTMGGRVSALCFEPGNDKTFYAGFASGGLWRTENRGVTFDPIFDKEITSSIGSVGVADAPADWSGWSKEDKKLGKRKREEKGRGAIIWVGTGEGNSRNSSSWGHGVYRSTDRGKKWTHCGLENTHDIPSLAIDPRDPDTCYVAALGHLWGANRERGVYKTTDGGKTWKAVLRIDHDHGCCDVHIDPKNPNTVYACMFYRRRSAHSFASGSAKGGIYKSTNAGKTWRKLRTGLPKTAGRIGIDIFDKDPSVLIATVESKEGGTRDIRDDRSRSGGVFRSENGGRTWKRLSVRTPRGWYFGRIYLDPKNSKRVYQLGWYTEVSDDGGKTFRRGFGDKMHVDMHALIISPRDTDHVVNGSDGGIYQTFDGGKKWQFLNVMAVGQFYNVSFDDSDPYRIIGGLQDNGTWVGPSSGTRQAEDPDAPKTGITNFDWKFVLWGDGFHAEFDPTDEDVVFAEWQGGNITRVNMRTGEFSRVAPHPAEGEPRVRFNWNSPFLVSAHDPKTLYIGGNHVFKLTERGDRWKRISPDLTTNDNEKSDTTGSTAETHCTVVTLAESALKKGLLWSGSDDGLIHVTTDDGKSWSDVTPRQVGGRYVSRIEASHHTQGAAYASVDGHRDDDMDPCILMTTNMGRSWSDISGDLPKGWSVKVVREDLKNKNVLYCGTENGMYVTTNRGKNWVSLKCDNLPTTPVDDIKQHPRTLDLILGTHGRSIWVMDDASMFGQLDAKVMKSKLHAFDPLPAKPRYFLNYGGLWTDQIFRGENRPLGAMINYWVGEYEADEVEIVIENADGNEVRKLTGPAAPGLNRVVWDLQPKEQLQLADKNQEPGQTFFVEPGVYKVKLKAGDETASVEVEVLAMDS
ncbi:MAG: glycosyl hydrolase [Armatimonadetes bacterium]|nr:glycosyl hydrolase [Armatimonadota bacterium]